MKSLDFVISCFKQSVYNTVPIKMAADAMISGKMKKMSSSDWKKVLDYVNSLRFPLRVYRGLTVLNKDDIDLSSKNIGVNWTIDKELFRDKSSHFQDCNYVITGEVQEDMVDWVETVQNYIYYSLENVSGRYPETEVTLKDGEKPSNLTVVEKDDIYNESCEYDDTFDEYSLEHMY